MTGKAASLKGLLTKLIQLQEVVGSIDELNISKMKTCMLPCCRNVIFQLVTVMTINVKCRLDTRWKGDVHQVVVYLKEQMFGLAVYVHGEICIRSS